MLLILARLETFRESAQVLSRRRSLCACAWGRDASTARRATATKLRKVGSGQCTRAVPWNQEGSIRKTIAVITSLGNQPTTRNSVASTIAQKPSSGRPIARPKSSTFQASQNSSGPRRIAAASADDRDREPAGNECADPKDAHKQAEDRVHAPELTAGTPVQHAATTQRRVLEDSAPPSHSSRGSLAPSDEKSPVSRIAVATSAIALTATQVRPPPTLTRCAPPATISASDSPGSASTLTGFETASHTARISSGLFRPGA